MEREGENEIRPLLRPMNSTSRIKRLKLACLKKPTGQTITGTILGVSFLALLSMLIVQNIDRSTQKSFEVDANLLGSTKKFTKKNFDQAWKKGENLVNSRNEAEAKFSPKVEYAPKTCPFSKMQQHFSAPVPQDEINCALVAEEVRRLIGKCIDISYLPASCKPWSKWRNKCKSTYKYRKFEGTCNNQVHPTWGTSRTPFVRMIEPAYADGISSIRKSTTGEPLPNARLLSTQLFSNQMKPDIDTTMLFVSFGLVLDHDMVQTATVNRNIPCCDETFNTWKQRRPRECLEIQVPESDPFYSTRNVKCLNFIRSVPVNGECGGRREQLNLATAYIDGSAFYGSEISQAKTLRSFSNGRLRMQFINNAMFMPADEASGYACGTPGEPLKCFKSGDPRVNMMVEATAMSTLWFREHNRIAEALRNVNPRRTDEILFQEARRILIAELQHITYNEFLPLVLGQEGMEEWDLKINPSRVYEGYDPTVDASVFNVFGSAAFRFGHSLIQGMLTITEANRTSSKVPLHEALANNHLLYHNGLDSILRGAMSQATHAVDSYASNEVRDRLFQESGKDYGLDLIAMGIQRGRDHGLPAYPAWRSICGLSEIRSWNDLSSLMDSERQSMLQANYKSVDDIDLMSGALAETPVQGSMVGPTFRCIIGRQFKKTRKGDRFWYEDLNQFGSLTKEQLDEIYKSSLARIICDNSDNIEEVQISPFTLPSFKNPIVKCSELPAVDLSKWDSKY